MNRTKVLLVLAFIVVCAAGAVVGTAVDRQVRPAVAVEDPLHLGLTPDQAAKMKTIWSAVGEMRRKVFTDRRQIEHQRRDDFEKLLTPEQLTLYKQIQQDYDAKFKALDDQLRQVEREADTKTRAILTADQIKKYDQMRTRMGPPRMGPPGFGPPHMRHDRDRHPMSAPATAPQGGSL